MFYWPAFLDAFPALLPGLMVTIELTVLVMPCALAFALALALARLYAPGPLASIATGAEAITRPSCASACHRPLCRNSRWTPCPNRV